MHKTWVKKVRIATSECPTPTPISTPPSELQTWSWAHWRNASRKKSRQLPRAVWGCSPSAVWIRAPDSITLMWKHTVADKARTMTSGTSARLMELPPKKNGDEYRVGSITARGRGNPVQWSLRGCLDSCTQSHNPGSSGQPGVPTEAEVVGMRRFRNTTEGI